MHARETADWVLEQVYSLPEEEKRYLLEQRRESVAFAIFPNVQRQGFMGGSLHGNGLLSYREPKGGWSPPILLVLQGQSTGPLFGAQYSSILFTFRTETGLKDFLREHHHVWISGEQTFIDHVDHTPSSLAIRVHAFQRGAMMGQSQDTYRISIDEAANASLYGVHLKPGCLVEATRSGFKAPWMLKYFESLQLEPGQASRLIDLE